MNTFTQTVTAWMPQYCYLTPEDFIAQKPGIAGSLGYTSNPESNRGEHGWTKVGTAEITLHLIDNDTMVLNKIDALKAEAAKTRADAALRCTEIEGQIQNLLAITYTPSADLARTAGDDGVTEDDPDFREVRDDTCIACDGTGEGSHDGATCGYCNGKGI